MTRHTAYISARQQNVWFNTSYVPDLMAGLIQMYLCWDRDIKHLVGYGALSVFDGAYWVTEGVLRKYRGQGYGTAILKFLLQVPRRFYALPVRAEIDGNNTASLKLHQHHGFRTTKVILELKN